MTPDLSYDYCKREEYISGKENKWDGNKEKPAIDTAGSRLIEFDWVLVSLVLSHAAAAVRPLKLDAGRLFDSVEDVQDADAIDGLCGWAVEETRSRRYQTNGKRLAVRALVLDTWYCWACY